MMIKGIATGDNGRTILLLGLSFENLDRLRAAPVDTYIKIDGRQLGLDIDVLVFSGETEEKMALEMAQPDTKVFR
jgi:hypothetical protein